jgi:hypothetical protein
MNILIDIRTPYHSLIIDKIFCCSLLNKYDNIFILTSCKLRKRIVIPSNFICKTQYIFYNHNVTKYYNILPFLFVFYKLLRKLKLFNFDLLTPINFGPLYLIIKLLNIRKEILYEDGISTYLDLGINNFFQKRFLNSSSLSIFITDKPNLVTNKDLKLFSIKLFNINIKKMNDLFNFFLSSSSVEYGLDNLFNYEKRLQYIHTNFDSSEHYRISFHHNELLIQDKLKIINKYFRNFSIIEKSVPVDEFVYSCKINNFIAPYNTTALNILSQKCASTLFLYNDNGPNISNRIFFFKSLSYSCKIINL